MRVTDSLLKDNIINYIMDTQERLADVQQQISTNKEVTVSSDDPVRFDRASRFRSIQLKNEQYLENIEEGIAWIQMGTESLDVVYETMTQLKEMALQTRDDLASSERAQILEYVESLIEEMVQMGNTKFMGKYIFGGTITKDTEPFAYDGSSVTYNGNDKMLTRKVGDDTYLQINTVGSEFTNVLDAAITLRDALVADDGAAMDVAIAQIDAVSPQLLNTIAVAGSMQRRFELTRDNLEMANVNLKSYISQAEDVDLAEAILQYNSQELAYRAALESSSRILNISILNHLR